MNSRNIKQITTEQLPRVVKLCVNAGLTPYIMGQPGVGKSQIIEKEFAMKEAERLGRKFVVPTSFKDWNKDNYCFSTIVVNQLSEVETRGMPTFMVYNKDTGEKITVSSLHEMWPIDPDAMGAIFFDEFSCAKTHIQTAFQSILTSRQVGNRKISEGISFIFCGNRPEDNSGTYEIASAMKNRVLWYELVPVDRLTKYYNNMSEIGRPIDIRIQAADQAVIISPHLDNFNTDDTVDQYCYGSRRMIEYLSNGIKDLSNIDDIELLASGCLGETAGAKFKAFLKLSLNVDIEGILKNPETINQYEQNGGLLYSICAAIVDRTKNTKPQVQNVIKVANALELSEYSMFMLLALKNKIGLKSLITTLKDLPEGKDVLTKLVNIVKEVDQ